ncbi:MAG: imidazole glycerol phosphate synthase subunit HisF [Clostridiales bacterium]|nr:imidazole glycerol phosphate synthase subunit HisF [Clostridiales bacterium]
MLTKRIIPCLDMHNGRVVKGINFENLTDAGDPIELAKYYSFENADEIAFLDISATTEGRKTMVDVIARAAEQVFIPIIVGGGIRELEDITALLNAGADKASINSAAFKNPDLIKQAASKFGSYRIVVAIDVKKNSQGGYDVYINGGKLNTGADAIEWAKKAVSLGAGELLITNIDTDGTKNGYDIELLKRITESVNVPVIASGGAGELEHFKQALTEGNCNAVLAASLFHYGILTINDVKKYLNKEGIPVRL